MTVDDVWRRYVDALCELARDGHVDALAHPDLPKIFGKRPEEPCSARCTSRAARRSRPHDVAVEISTAGLRKPVGELYPDAALLEACVARGVPITLASDAHEPISSASTSTRRLRSPSEAGCETVTVFEGGSARREPLG